MSNERENFWLELLIVLAICWLLFGCAVQERFCGVKVCYPPGGASKVDPDRDCMCSGKTADQVIQEMQL